METAKTYLQSIDASVLPGKAASILTYDILTDEGINLLDEKNPVFLEIQEIINSKYPAALKNEEPTPIPAAEPEPANKKEYYAGLIKGMETLVRLSQDKKKKAAYRKVIKGYKLLIKFANAS